MSGGGMTTVERRRSRGRRRSDRKWPRILRDFWLFIITGVTVLALLNATDATNRIAGDEQHTCVIQQRGLPAAHALVSVVSDLHYLVAIPLSAQQRRALAERAPKLHAAILARYHDLSVNAARYAELESKQPRTRIC